MATLFVFFILFPMFIIGRGNSSPGDFSLTTSPDTTLEEDPYITSLETSMTSVDYQQRSTNYRTRELVTKTFSSMTSENTAEAPGTTSAFHSKPPPTNPPDLPDHLSTTNADMPTTSSDETTSTPAASVPSSSSERESEEVMTSEATTEPVVVSTVVTLTDGYLNTTLIDHTTPPITDVQSSSLEPFPSTSHSLTVHRERTTLETPGDSVSKKVQEDEANTQWIFIFVFLITTLIIALLVSCICWCVYRLRRTGKTEEKPTEITLASYREISSKMDGNVLMSESSEDLHFYDETHSNDALLEAAKTLENQYSVIDSEENTLTSFAPGPGNFARARERKLSELLAIHANRDSVDSIDLSDNPRLKMFISGENLNVLYTAESRNDKQHICDI